MKRPELCLGRGGKKKRTLGDKREKKTKLGGRPNEKITGQNSSGEKSLRNWGKKVLQEDGRPGGKEGLPKKKVVIYAGKNQQINVKPRGGIKKNTGVLKKLEPSPTGKRGGPRWLALPDSRPPTNRQNDQKGGARQENPFKRMGGGVGGGGTSRYGGEGWQSCGRASKSKFLV